MRTLILLVVGVALGALGYHAFDRRETLKARIKSICMKRDKAT